nr:hypothetical protein [Niallia taxi]
MNLFRKYIYPLLMKGIGIVGVTACADGTKISLRLDKKRVEKHLGFFKG